MTLNPIQLPERSTEIRGITFIEYHNPDNQIILYAKPIKGGGIIVHGAERYGWNEKEEDWTESEFIEIEDAISWFECEKVLNPITRNLAKLQVAETPLLHGPSKSVRLFAFPSYKSFGFSLATSSPDVMRQPNAIISVHQTDCIPLKDGSSTSRDISGTLLTNFHTGVVYKVQ